MHYLHSSKTILTAGVSHSGELCSVGLGDDWFEPRGPLLIWVGGGCQGEDWLRLGRLLNPVFAQAMVEVVV